MTSNIAAEMSPQVRWWKSGTRGELVVALEAGVVTVAPLP
jgi:hypothetical protein